MTKKTKQDRWKEQQLEKSKPVLPLNDKQKEYIQAIYRSPTVFCLGPAGTGKTYCAAAIAAELYIRGTISKIILTRPMIPVGKSAGLLPGSLDEKLEPWFRPITEVLLEKLGEGKYEIARKNHDIEFAPFEQMQGRSFKNAFIILDEAQNSSPFELKMFLTRLGEGTKTIVDGDVAQCSLKEGSGLRVVLNMIANQLLPVPVIEFCLDDIVRSGQCRMWIEAFAKVGH
jgi:phosphate starvation-inducible PhoH-like protein